MAIRKMIENMGEGITFEKDFENGTSRIYVEDDVQGDFMIDLDAESEDWYDEELMDEAQEQVDDLFRRIGIR